MVGAIRAVGDEVVEVVSSDLDRVRDFTRQHGIAHALDAEADLTSLEVDAVYISSPSVKHEALTVFVAAQCWHVLCEKPLTTSLGAARRMVAACRRAGVVLGTNHHMRHNSAHRQMRDVVRAATLGRLKAARVHHAVYLPVHLQCKRLTDQAAGGGVVLDIAVHKADSLALCLASTRPKSPPWSATTAWPRA